MVLPENPGFKTKHLVTIILGNGARKIDVIDNPEHSPFQTKMAAEGTVFTEDYGETANLHGYMYSEVLSGVDAPPSGPGTPPGPSTSGRRPAGRRPTTGPSRARPTTGPGPGM